MLVSLRIANYVLIDDTRISLHPGLNVLTGETGSGKSIVIDALSLILGERASSEGVRDAQKEAVIEAEFHLSEGTPSSLGLQTLLNDIGIEIESGTLLIQRTFSAEGRSRIFINNTQCLLKKLREIGDWLVDLHGQHEHQSLLHKSSYLSLLDCFTPDSTLRDRYRETYREWTRLRSRFAALEDDEREHKRREATLQFQIAEITNAQLQPEEDDQIETRLQIIQHAERLAERAAEILKPLTDGAEDRPSILDELGRMEHVLDSMKKIDPSILPLTETWQSSLIALQEASLELQQYARNLDFDSGELERLQQRHFLIRDLKAKYGDTLLEVLQYREEMEKELEAITHLDEEKAHLLEQCGIRQNELQDAAARIHAIREKTAASLSDTISKELQNLGMERAKFSIQVDYRTGKNGLRIDGTDHVILGPDGGDDIEFLVSTIPDKPPRPLREVASGGEVSRLMLALKCVFGEADPVPTMVFDEIDVGVGGKTADAVADRLALLAKTKQVLCITHLPQIASRADLNLQIQKETVQGRLQSLVRPLKGKEREMELARMLGTEDSSATKRLAREMLKTARK